MNQLQPIGRTVRGLSHSTPSFPHVPPLPVPNLGYTAENITLARQKPLIKMNRACQKKTLETKGLGHISSLALANCRDMAAVLAWNAAHGIRLFRISSQLFPWSSVYSLEQLPDYEEIVLALRKAGELARATNQRLTMHPPHFVKLGTKQQESLLQKSMNALELHSKVFHLMGYTPSAWNKINIHVGGVYGSKSKTLARWARSYDRLSHACRARVTVENDDTPNSYSLSDLLSLHELCGVPLVFDLHHHRFCPGTLSQEDALGAAIDTWPVGVRPVVHWSEEPECPQKRASHPHAHSNFVYGPINVYGREEDVDIMIEAKARELALLLYRDELLKHHAIEIVPPQKVAMIPSLSS